MKNFITFITSILLCVNAYTQVSKTVDLTSAGTLSSILTTEELSTVTDLTITGYIDARDFAIMRNNMTALINLDISNSIIEAYTGTVGGHAAVNSYPANAIPTDAFYFAYSPIWGNPNSTLTTIILPESITIIDRRAFQSCIALSEIFIPSNVDSIAISAFDNSTASILVSSENLHFSSSDGVLFNKDKTKLIHCPISKIGDYTIPSTVTDISSNAFIGCKELTSIDFSENVLSLGEGCFSGCIGLETLDLPPLISTIPRFCFSNCTSLSYLRLPDSITSINNGCFTGCTSLENLSIPASTTYINSYIGSIPLKELYVYADIPPSTLDTAFMTGIPTETCVLFVPNDAKTIYQSTFGWSDFQYIIEIDSSCLYSKTTDTTLKFITYPEIDTIIYDSVNVLTNISDCDSIIFYFTEYRDTTNQITCSDTTIKDTITYLVYTPEFEAKSPLVILDKIDSLTSSTGDCDSVIYSYTQYLHEDRQCLSDTVYITIHDTIQINNGVEILEDSTSLIEAGYIAGELYCGDVHSESKWVNSHGMDTILVHTMQHRLYDASRIYDENENLIWEWLGENASATWYNRDHVIGVAGNDSIKLEFYQGYNEFCGGYLQVIKVIYDFELYSSYSDTIYTTIYDTVDVENHITINDTIWHNDTLTINQTIYDTTFVTKYDTVTIEDHIAVTDTLIIEIETSSGLNSESVSTIKVYPNPAKDYVVLDINNQPTISSYLLTISSNTGKTVYETYIYQTQFQISVDDIGNAGIYYIRVYNDSGSIIQTKVLILQ